MEDAVRQYEKRIMGNDVDIRNAESYLAAESRRIWALVSDSGKLNPHAVFRLRSAVRLKFPEGGAPPGVHQMTVVATDSGGRETNVEIETAGATLADLVVRFNTICILIRYERPIPLAPLAATRTFGAYATWLTSAVEAACKAP